MNKTQVQVELLIKDLEKKKSEALTDKRRLELESRIKEKREWINKTFLHG